MFKTALMTAATCATLMFGAPFAETQAGETALAGSALRSAVSGKTIFLKISGFELPIHYASGGTMKGSMGTVAAAFARGDGLPTPANGGSPTTSSARNGGRGWRATPIATSSARAAARCAGCAMTAARAPRASAANAPLTSPKRRLQRAAPPREGRLLHFGFAWSVRGFRTYGNAMQSPAKFASSTLHGPSMMMRPFSMARSAGLREGSPSGHFDLKEPTQPRMACKSVGNQETYKELCNVCFRLTLASALALMVLLPNAALANRKACLNLDQRYEQIQRGASTIEIDTCCSPPPTRAARNSRSQLLDNGASLEARDRFGSQPLAHAAAPGKPRSSRCSWIAARPIDAQNIDGSTALYKAAEAGRLAIVQQLVEQGADVRLAGRSGITPFPPRPIWAASPSSNC